MTIRLALAATLLALAPGLAVAKCFDGHREMSTSHCIEGQTWDPATQACVSIVTG